MFAFRAIGSVISNPTPPSTPSDQFWLKLEKRLEIIKSHEMKSDGMDEVSYKIMLETFTINVSNGKAMKGKKFKDVKTLSNQTSEINRVKFGPDVSIPVHGVKSMVMARWFYVTYLKDSQNVRIDLPEDESWVNKKAVIAYVMSKRVEYKDRLKRLEMRIEDFCKQNKGMKEAADKIIEEMLQKEKQLVLTKLPSP